MGRLGVTVTGDYLVARDQPSTARDGQRLAPASKVETM